MEDNVEIENSEEGELWFETDHLALRGNRDYSALLKYVIELQLKQEKALKDIEELGEAKNKALEDPLKFVEDLKKGNVSFPVRQKVPDLPRIQWSMYGFDNIMESEDLKTNDLNSDITNMMIRGRKFTDNKPETFNQLWSCEEQRRLEELLEIYPEEAIESRRYKKVAKALGTRTTVQVMSRIQKYFTKLAKAGLPIPGRQPKGVGRDRSRTNTFYKKSTFFPHLHVPVKMEDPNESSNEPLLYESSNGSRSVELLKYAKEQRILDEKSPIWQTKTMCVGCQKTKFLGARWTDNAGTDYCTDCLVRLLPEEKLIPVREE